MAKVATSGDDPHVQVRRTKDGAPRMHRSKGRVRLARYAGEDGSKARDTRQLTGTSTLNIDSSDSTDLAATVVTGCAFRR